MSAAREQNATDTDARYEAARDQDGTKAFAIGWTNQGERLPQWSASYGSAAVQLTSSETSNHTILQLAHEKIAMLEGMIDELRARVENAAQMEADFVAAMRSIGTEERAALPDALADWEATLEERENGTPLIAAPPETGEMTGLPPDEALDALHKMLANCGG